MDLREFEQYESGTLLKIIWDRSNGELIRNYIYYGSDVLNNNEPLLIDCQNLGEEKVTFFDVSNSQIKINSIEKIDFYFGCPQIDHLIRYYGRWHPPIPRDSR